MNRSEILWHGDTVAVSIKGVFKGQFVVTKCDESIIELTGKMPNDDELYTMRIDLLQNCKENEKRPAKF